MRLLKQKLNKYSILFILVVLFIFLEVIVMSPNILEKNNNEYEELEQIVDSSQEDKSSDVEQKMRGVHLIENGGKEKAWELFADEATGTADSQWAVSQVKIRFFADNKLNYTVTGDLGEIDGTTKDMIIRGNVKTSSANGYNFKTDTLRYLSKQKLMTSVDRVVMEGPADKSGIGFRLNGEKLLVDVAKNKMSILDKVLATKQINGKNFRLTSVRADFSNNSQEAQFSGDVDMNLGAFYVKAPLANFYYSDDTKALMKIIMKYGVFFTEGERKGTCDVLEMDLQENKMTLRGQPKVQQGDDEIRGQEIVFIDGGKKVKINKSSSLK